MLAFHNVVAASLLVAAGGCVLPVPIHVQGTPHVAGTVLDERTKAAVAEAHLHWELIPERVVITSVDGRFDFPAIYRWTCPGSTTFWGPTLVVEAPGYHTTNSIFRNTMTRGNVVIELKPQGHD